MKPNTKLIVISVLISVVSSILITNILLSVKGSPLFSDASSRFGLPKPRTESLAARELSSPQLFSSLVNNGSIDDTINIGIIGVVNVYLNEVVMTMRGNTGSELMFNFDTLVPVVMGYNQSLLIDGDGKGSVCDIYADWSEGLMNLYNISRVTPFRTASYNASNEYKTCVSWSK